MGSPENAARFQAHGLQSVGFDHRSVTSESGAARARRCFLPPRPDESPWRYAAVGALFAIGRSLLPDSPSAIQITTGSGGLVVGAGCRPRSCMDVAITTAGVTGGMQRGARGQVSWGCGR